MLPVRAERADDSRLLEDTRRHGRDRDTLIETAATEMNGLDPPVWLAETFNRISGHPSNRIDDLLPWSCKPDSALSDAARLRESELVIRLRHSVE